jgi:nucleoside-diphosphate-sugar epimerase
MIDSTNNGNSNSSKEPDSRLVQSRRVLLLGANGFLGRNLKAKLLSPSFGIDEVLVYDRKENQIVVNDITTSPKHIKIEDAAPNSPTDLIVINCLSARKPSNSYGIKQANYSKPKLIFERIRDLNFNTVTWIQPESYWQYASSSIPDEEYVHWKKEFSRFLQVQSKDEFFRAIPLVICHLIGSDDDKTRFVPKLIHSLRTKERVEIINPEETLLLSDVKDVARYLAHAIKHKSLPRQGAAHLFPYERISIRQLTELILEVIPENPGVDYVSVPTRFTPVILDSFDSLPVLDASLMPTLRQTLQRISNELHK